MKPILFISLVLVFCFSVVSCVPANGVYVSLRSDIMKEIGEDLSLEIADVANTYTATPAVSGETSQVKYTLSNFVYDIDLEDFYYNNGAPTNTFGWASFDFIFQFNYHVCARIWPNPCEDGWVIVYSTDNQVNLQLTANILLNQPLVNIQVTAANLLFQQGEIDIYVQCTSTLCIIPVGDIADAVAQQFVSTFQSGIVTIANTALNNKVNTYPTTIPIPEYGLSLNLVGGFEFLPAQPNANLVLYGEGVFQNGIKSPPDNPLIAPPDSIFTSPSPLQIVVTQDLVDDLFFAIATDPLYVYTITNQNLPADSPVVLNTNSFFWQSVAPGLAQYPNTNMSVSLKLASKSAALFEGGGPIFAQLSIYATFNLLSGSTSKPAFTLEIDVYPNILLSVKMMGANSLFVNTTITTWGSPNVTVLSSTVGSVSTFAFSFAMSGILALIPSPSFNLPVPPEFAMSDPTLTYGIGYLVLGANVQYLTAINSITCADGIKKCPLQNTCCKWGSSYGCCTLPNANCCDSGCCGQFYQCVNGGCAPTSDVNLGI
eukprot:TRINITY_DN3489_c0_g2_i1.p1 TRINITY_DN3489_c0_g2~~TRINITY_DN3489_c0_g2_i1.p1  ORF type:complete len:552 (+),score=115.27 TRINITY_DN3489_c0_g2_i1:31-1656(+)